MNPALTPAMVDSALFPYGARVRIRDVDTDGIFDATGAAVCGGDLGTVQQVWVWYHSHGRDGCARHELLCDLRRIRLDNGGLVTLGFDEMELL